MLQLFDRISSALWGMDRIHVGLSFRYSGSSLCSILFDRCIGRWSGYIESFPRSFAQQFLRYGR